MTSTFRVLVRVLCVFAIAASLGAEGIPNWPAPASWSPSESPSSRTGHGLSPERAAIIQPPRSPYPFIGLTPCRIADTRGNGFTGAYGPPSMAAGVPRDFTLPGRCGIPGAAAAVSLNITVTNTLGPGFISIYPQAATPPTVSTLNYVAGQTVANAAVVPLGDVGGVTVVAGVSGTDLIIDVNGYYGGQSFTNHNVFLGPVAGNTDMTGSGNTGIGWEVLPLLTSGDNNTAVGIGALHGDTTGFQNTGIGADALFANQAGTNNTAVGFSALASCADCSSNTGAGWQALINNVNGFFNVAVGGNALYNITSGSDSNIAVGYGAALNLISGTNNIHIGNPALSTESNTIRIGTGDGVHTKFFVAGVRGVTTGQANAIPVMIDFGGQLGTVSSSARVKKEIEDIGEGSSAILRLRPVSFLYRNDTVGYRQYGLIAEEVADVMPELVQYSECGDPETVNYHFLAPLLVNELQKQQKTIERQRDVITQLEARLARLEARLSADPGR